MGREGIRICMGIVTIVGEPYLGFIVLGEQVIG